MAAQKLAHLALFTVASIYGANFTIAKIVMDDDHLHPLAFILLRALSGVFLFWLFHQIAIREKVAAKDFPLLFLCGVFGVAVNQTFFFSGLKLTTPINASLIMTMSPILVMISAAILIKEPITRRKVAGILVGGMGAVLLIAYGKKVSVTEAGWWGDFLIFVNACSYGLYLVLVRTLVQRYHPLTVIKWVFAFGCLLVIPLGTGPLMQTDWSRFTPVIWMALVYVLLLTNFLSYFLNGYALTLLSPSVVSTYIYLQPLLATVFALWLGKDTFDWIKGAAGLLIFAGVFLVSYRPKARIELKK